MDRDFRCISAPARGFSVLGLVLFVAAVAALAAVPELREKPYVLHMGVVLFLAIIQGQAWNVVGGYAGQYSVGHAAYFGIGAYATMMLLRAEQDRRRGSASGRRSPRR